MKSILSALLFLIYIFSSLCADKITDLPDFTITDINRDDSGALHLTLKNISDIKSEIDFISPDHIFLKIQISGKIIIFRIRELSSSLFDSNSSLVFNTKIKVEGNVEVMCEINPEKIIKESDYLNNSKTKAFVKL